MTFPSSSQRRHGTDRSAGGEQDHPSLAAIGRLALRHFYLVAGLGLIAAGIVVAMTLTRPRSYTSAASFIPQAPNGGVLSNLSGFAAQIGLNVPADDPGSSPAFYASLLKSNEILRQVVLTPYTIDDNGAARRTSLVEIFAPAGDNPGQRRDDAIQAMLQNMMVMTGRETGIVSIEVTSPFPSLSRDVANRLLQLASEFNLERRQTNAGAERRFIEARLAETRDSLHAIQEELQNFLQHNRDFRNAPALVFAHDRMQRELQLRQEVYVTLMQSYEQARIDEVRNTPVLTIVEPPTTPSRPDPRWTLVKGVLALLVGAFLGIVIAAIREMIASTRPRAI